jgi:hypothetical protein
MDTLLLMVMVLVNEYVPAFTQICPPALTRFMASCMVGTACAQSTPVFPLVPLGLT